VPEREPEHPAFEDSGDPRRRLRHIGPHHLPGPGGASVLVVQSAEGLWRFGRGQKVWDRQMNPESQEVSA
jgi:hypothetical protein